VQEHSHSYGSSRISLAVKSGDNPAAVHFVPFLKPDFYLSIIENFKQ
jgi:hypothetical protein